MTTTSETLPTAHQHTFFKIAAACIFAVLVGAIVLLSWVPPVSRDALTHHLAVPKLYLEHGGIYEIPSIGFSYYPMNLDLLYLIPLYYGNDIAPKFIHFGFAALTAWLIYSYLVKWLGMRWALFGSVFFLSVPIIVKLSITAYVDLGLVFFSTAAILDIFKWIENRFQLSYLIRAGIWCGLALGTKYNGLLVLFILTFFVPLIFISRLKKERSENRTVADRKSRSYQIKAIGFGALFCGVALLVFSPWMIRNYIWKDNPIYPLYDRVFQNLSTVFDETAEEAGASATNETAPDSSSRWGPFAVRKVIYGESWWEIALIPVRVFFQGRDDHPKYFDGKLNPFLFILPFLTFIHFKKIPAVLRTEKKILAFFAVIFLLYAFSQYSIRIRYIAPIIPPLVILATFGLHRIAALMPGPGRDNSTRAGIGLALVVAAFLLSYNAAYIVKQFHLVDPLSYISGRVSRDAYISRFRPEYEIYQQINQHESDGIKILGLFLGNRRYYCDKELIFGIDEFKQVVNGADSANELLNKLRTRGYTHLIVRYDLFNRWANRQFDDSGKRLLPVLFTKHLALLISKGGYGLYQLD